MSETSLRQRLLSGETVLGTFQTINSPEITELVGISGFDFVILDQEHGPLTAESSIGLSAVAENRAVEPIVRVRDNSEGEIQRALDIGAGVEIPQIECLADAETAVDAARFAPEGERGLSPYVRAGDYDGGADYTDRQNETATVIVHIEGERGIKNVDDILSVDGIDVVFLGPYDLSQSLGLTGQVRDDRVEEKMETVCEKAADADTVIGTYADDAEMAQRWIDAGAQYVAVSVDGPVVRNAFEDLRSNITIE